MEEQLKELKSVLRSLAVSSPTEVDMRSLMRDYRTMMGEPFPLSRFGYRDTLAFLKEKCSDCFLIQDSGCNPVLTLIVPDTVKHIDKFVQKQKAPPMARFKGKRRSIAESSLRNDLIVKTFKPRTNKTDIIEERTKENTDHNINDIGNNDTEDNDHNDNDNDTENNDSTTYYNNRKDSGDTNGVCSSNALQNFMKKRMPLLSESQCLSSETSLDKGSSKGDTDSGRLTASTGSSTKRTQLEELKSEIRELISEVPEGVWCTELMRLYREKYGRQLRFSRFGFTSVQSLAYAVEGLQRCVAAHTAEVLLRTPPTAPAASPPPAPPPPPPPPRTAPSATSLAAQRAVDPEDALPGIDFDEDVFPKDCMHLMQSIPSQELGELAPGAMLEVVVGEVYSPTHFWLLRLGPNHYTALEKLMDEMNEYYKGSGAERWLAAGAVRAGHYCACLYHGDWHRAIIVKVIDSDNVKVRHIDYATVERAAARSLKPLRREWAALAAQAVRARLAGVRPSAAGRRWPWAAAAHFLRLVHQRTLVANIVAVDQQEGILEVLLIDTSTEEDVCISTEMTRSGHADLRPDSALGTSECYLYPRFEALENGDTPNYGEIYCYLRDGISLEFVEDYRRHVPPCLPPPPAAAPSPPPPSPPPAAPSPPPSPAPPSPAASTRSLGPAAAPRPPPPPRQQRAASLGPASPDPASWRKSVGIANRIPLLRPEVKPGSSPHIPLPQSKQAPDCHQPPRRPLYGGFPTSYYPPMCPTGPAPAHSMSSFPTYFPVAPPTPGFATFVPMTPPVPIIANGPMVPPPQMGPRGPGAQNVTGQMCSNGAMAPPMQMCPGGPMGYPGQMGPNGPMSLPFQMFPGNPMAPPVHMGTSGPTAPTGSTGSNEPTLSTNGTVSLSASDCEVFALLSRVDPGMAQRFMMDALRRAMAATSVSGGGGGGGERGAGGGGEAASTRVSAETQTELRPPPGFGHVTPAPPHPPQPPQPPQPPPAPQ